MEEPEASKLVDYDGAFVIGTYTWGDGELPDDFFGFYDKMESIHLNGRKAAILNM